MFVVANSEFTTICHDRSMPDGESLLHQKRQSGRVLALSIFRSFAKGGVSTMLYATDACTFVEQNRISFVASESGKTELA